MNTVENKVVLVTGVSSGLGRELALSLLAKGAFVAGTCKTRDEADSFIETTGSENALGLVMDITDDATVTSGVNQAIDRYGRIDILVNNAGAGMIGAIEEFSDAESRKLLDINFFGGLAVIRAVLPHMRNQKSGRIALCSAIGGFHGVPGFGLYASAKGATNILGESLAAELEPFGISVTAIIIGLFDTGMATRVLPTENEIKAYAGTPAEHFRGFIESIPGNEPNDPVKGAQAIVRLLESNKPPIYAALGADAHNGMRKKLKDVEAELAEWEENAISTLKG